MHVKQGLYFQWPQNAWYMATRNNGLSLELNQ